MNNFEFYNPTRIIFGSDTISRLADLVPADHQIVLCYGQGSLKATGTYDQIKQALGERIVLECSGIPANPEYDQLLEFLGQIRRFDKPFLLAAGGGSVVDGVKFIAAAAFATTEPWDILAKGAPVRQAWPLGVVLTLPATGSESNGNSVISRRSIGEKLAFGSSLVQPVFAILDPATTTTLNARQTANGVVDSFVHICEQYLTRDTDNAVTDGIAETLLSVLVEKGPQVLRQGSNLNLRATIMWASTLALNGLLECGTPGDWATHGIGHELTALYGLDHAQTLAIILPGVLEYKKEAKFAKLLRYARQVWGLHQGDERVLVDEAIARTVLFFESLGCGSRLRDYNIDAREAADAIAGRMAKRAWKLGEDADIDSTAVHAIVMSRA